MFQSSSAVRKEKACVVRRVPTHRFSLLLVSAGARCFGAALLGLLLWAAALWALR